MGVRYSARVRWPENPTQLDHKKFNITVPTGLKAEQIRTPQYVDVTVMGQKAKAAHGSFSDGRLSIVNGLVTRSLEVHFANPATQWKRLSTSSQGPGTFQFQGGEIYLDLRLAIFVLDHLQPKSKDPVSGKIFAEIYSHELLHVLDEIEIVTHALPHALQRSRELQKLLSEPFTYGRSADSIHVVTAGFYEYIRQRIEGIVMADHWAPLTNERAATRDAPSEYAKVQEKIDSLRASYTMGKKK